MFMGMDSLKPRTQYLKKLIAFQNTEQVKVITGIRRCGKSSLMKLMIKHLLESGNRGRSYLVYEFRIDAVS